MDTGCENNKGLQGRRISLHPCSGESLELHLRTVDGLVGASSSAPLYDLRGVNISRWQIVVDDTSLLFSEFLSETLRAVALKVPGQGELLSFVLTGFLFDEETSFHGYGPANDRIQKGLHWFKGKCSVNTPTTDGSPLIM